MKFNNNNIKYHIKLTLDDVIKDLLNSNKYNNDEINEKLDIILAIKNKIEVYEIYTDEDVYILYITKK